MLKLVGSALVSLSLLVVAACGSSSPKPAEPAPAAASEPATDASCYVTKVKDQDGCWISAEEACSLAACTTGTCACTEATANNTCSCQGG